MKPTLVLLTAALLFPLAAQSAAPRKKGDQRTNVNLKAGQPAPDFTLKTMDGARTVTLSSFQGKKPVVLVFGSYT